jgi:hypothetical protein
MFVEYEGMIKVRVLFIVNESTKPSLVLMDKLKSIKLDSLLRDFHRRVLTTLRPFP